MRFILAPDSFKGTLSADQICSILEEVIQSHIADAEIIKIPLSDGGEGLVSSLLHLCGGSRISASVTGPHFETVACEYGLLPDDTAVIEMASCAGLPLVTGPGNPYRTTTYGVGELILDAAGHGCKKIILGLGGSATNDGGIGMASALGYRFLDGSGNPLTPIGGSLNKICRILLPRTPFRIPVVAACDVSNPLCGPEGAAFTFGRQKGATPKMQRELDLGLKNLAEVLKTDMGLDVLDIPGTGAAGGLGAGVIAFLHGELRPGIQLILDAAGFDRLLDQADYVITGEGRIDWQSAYGKVPVGVAQRARARHVPCFALCGSVGKNAQAVYAHGITAIYSSVNRPASFEEVAQTSEEDFRFLADAFVRTLATFSNNIVNDISPGIGTHADPGTLGLL